MARCGGRHRLTPVDGAIIAAKLNNVTNPSVRRPIGRTASSDREMSERISA